MGIGMKSSGWLRSLSDLKHDSRTSTEGNIDWAGNGMKIRITLRGMTFFIISVLYSSFGMRLVKLTCLSRSSTRITVDLRQ